MIMRHLLRRTHRPRAGLPARKAAAAIRASDVILILSAAVLVGLAGIKIFLG